MIKNKNRSKLHLSISSTILSPNNNNNENLEMVEMGDDKNEKQHKKKEYDNNLETELVRIDRKNELPNQNEFLPYLTIYHLTIYHLITSHNIYL